MAEQPLSDRELRIVRGMIDEYEYREMRGKFFRASGHNFRVALGALFFVLLFAINVIQLAVMVSGK